MRDLTSKISYIRGLADGLSLAEKGDEGKVITELIDVIEDLCEQFEDLSDYVDTLDEAIDEIDDSLVAVADELDDFTGLDASLDSALGKQLANSSCGSKKSSIMMAGILFIINLSQKYSI